MEMKYYQNRKVEIEVQEAKRVQANSSVPQIEIM
jgi:hypothetical protein